MSPLLINSCSSSGFTNRLKFCLYGAGYSRHAISVGTGIAEPVLADYANGTTQPILSDIEKIARFVQVNPAWLAFRIGEKKLPSETELIAPYLNDAGLSPEQLEDKYRQAGKNEHPLFNKTTWAFSIGEDDTVLEYWAWVAFRLGRALGHRSPPLLMRRTAVALSSSWLGAWLAPAGRPRWGKPSVGEAVGLSCR